MALLEASRRQESGDTAGAWDCHRAVLRMITHMRRRGGPLQRCSAKRANPTLQRRLADWAADRPIVLLGSNLDSSILGAVASRSASNVPRVELAVSQLGVLAAFLDQAAAYVGMDTGPMHIAAALGRP